MLESIKKIEEETKEAIKFKDMLESVQKSIYDKKLKIIMYRRKIEDLQKTFDMTQSTMAKFKQDVIKVGHKIKDKAKEFQTQKNLVENLDPIFLNLIHENELINKEI